MTEAEWLASVDPVKMLDWLKARKIRARKLRLFGAACGRRLWPWLADERSKAAIAALEVFADSPGKQPDKERLREAWKPAYVLAKADKSESPAAVAASAARVVSEPTDAHHATRWGAKVTLDAAEAWGRAGEPAALARLLREVLGNPRAKTTFDAAWRTPGVLSVAQAAYDERLPVFELDTARLAVLADALEEAGCTDEAALTHLRSPGPHVRGCWALDLVLAKQ
jgi:hypothetical protein